MQLQEKLETIQEAKLQVIAVSYDSVDVLKAFTKKAEIEFPLLSDPDSKTIEAYHVRNDEMAGKRIDGVPHPGTFLIDQERKVVAKLFYEGYKKRHKADDILKAFAKLKETREQEDVSALKRADASKKEQVEVPTADE